MSTLQQDTCRCRFMQSMFIYSLYTVLPIDVTGREVSTIWKNLDYYRTKIKVAHQEKAASWCNFDRMSFLKKYIGSKSNNIKFIFMYT